MEKNDNKNLIDYLYAIEIEIDNLDISDLQKDLLKDLQRNFLYKNLPCDAQRSLKKFIQEEYISRIEKEKSEKKSVCGHLGCPDKSIDSHEISNAAFISELRNDDGQVFVLYYDLKGNPLYSEFTKISPRKATIFPGYCEFHDKNLFKEIDERRHNQDLLFYNKQCLRTLHREKFELKYKILIQRSLVLSIKNSQFKHIFSEKIEEIENNINLCELMLNFYEKIYQIIFDGIEYKKYKIKFLEYDCNKKNYVFSSLLDYTDYERCSDPVFIFLYKLNFNNNAKFIICYFDNKESKESAENLMEDYLRLGEIFYMKRKRFVFSESFFLDLEKKNSFSFCMLKKNMEEYLDPIAYLQLAFDFLK